MSYKVLTKNLKEKDPKGYSLRKIHFIVSAFDEFRLYPVKTLSPTTVCTKINYAYTNDIDLAIRKINSYIELHNIVYNGEIPILERNEVKHQKI